MRKGRRTLDRTAIELSVCVGWREREKMSCRIRLRSRSSLRNNRHAVRLMTVVVRSINRLERMLVPVLVTTLV